MAGGREFDRERLEVFTKSLLSDGPPLSGADVAWRIYTADMIAFRHLGKSLTGATWFKGRSHPEVREVGEGWFERRSLELAPWWARLAGRLIGGWALWTAARR